MSSPKAKVANLSTLTARLQVRAAVYAHRVRHHAGLLAFSSPTNSETTKQITLSCVSLKFSIRECAAVHVHPLPVVPPLSLSSARIIQQVICLV